MVSDLLKTLEAGMSPLSVVYQRDLEYEKTNEQNQNENSRVILS